MNWEVSARPLLVFKVWYLFSPRLGVFPVACNKWVCSLRRGGVEMAVSCSPEVLPRLAGALCSGQSRPRALYALSQAEELERPRDGVGTMRQSRDGHEYKKLMTELNNPRRLPNSSFWVDV